MVMSRLILDFVSEDVDIITEQNFAIFIHVSSCLFYMNIALLLCLLFVYVNNLFSYITASLLSSITASLLSSLIYNGFSSITASLLSSLFSLLS